MKLAFGINALESPTGMAGEAICTMSKVTLTLGVSGIEAT